MTRQRRLAVRCPSCEARLVAAMPEEARAYAARPAAARGSDVSEENSRALSYERLQAALSDLFGFYLSQGGLMNLLHRAQARFRPDRAAAFATLRRTKVVASDETGIRIEGSRRYHWVFRSGEAVVHTASPTRGAVVVQDMIDRHRSAVWISDHYTAQQGHADHHQTCLAHLARDVGYAVAVSADPVPLRLQLWLQSVFALAERVIDLACSTLAIKRRTLERRLADILSASSRCDLTRALQVKIGRARDQVLVFLLYPGTVEVTHNGCEHLLRPAVVERKVTNRYGAMWAATGEADIRTVVDTARLTGASPFATILATVGA